jgi:hypothetical protein
MQLPIYKTEKNEYSVLREQKIYLFEQMCNYQIQVLKLLIFYIECTLYVYSIYQKYPHGINSNYVAFAR